jgi:Mrp family chromosome partitioning ATPase
VVVDGNEETGDLSDLLAIDDAPGLAELLENPQIAVNDVVFARPRGPSVVSRGRSSRIDLVDPAAARRLVDRLAAEFEVVLFAAAPIHQSGSALVWARSTQRVLLVAERDRAKRDDLAYAVESLSAIGASVIGSVLVERAPRPRRGRARRQRPSGLERGAVQPPDRRSSTAGYATVPSATSTREVPSRPRPSDGR